MRSRFTLLLVAGLVFASTGAVNAASSQPLSDASVSRIDLSTLLSPDGAFVGRSGANGVVDMAGWRMTSNMAAGEAPHFAASPASPQALETVSSWTGLGSNGAGNGALNTYVSALAMWNGKLVVGGGFTNAAGNALADYLVVWNGLSWAGVGSNGAGNGALNGEVRAIALIGNDLYVGGQFTNAAGVSSADYLARWNGNNWAGLGNGNLSNWVKTLATNGSSLFVGGFFVNVAGIAAADYAARWDTNNNSWHAIDNATVTPAITGTVWSMTYNNGNLYIGGDFLNAAGKAKADRVVKWNGTNWSALGSNAAGTDGAIHNGTVFALITLSNSVYAGGSFTNVAGMATADYIASFDGTVWHGLGSNGAGDGAVNGEVDALAVGNNHLYVGGDFFGVANIGAAVKIAMWNGARWFAVGADDGGGWALGGGVYALTVGNSYLYVGGIFSDAADIATADYLAGYGPLSTLNYQPDGRIKKGSTGTLVGNDIYNTSGTNQTRSASRAIGTSVTYYIVGQNDGTAGDTFRVHAMGTAVSGYGVRYYTGATEITSQVVAGTYQTALISPQGTFTIKAVAAVNSGAAVGSSVSREVELISVTDPTMRDTVKFVVKRS